MSRNASAEDGASETLQKLLEGFVEGIRESDSEHLLRRIVFCVQNQQKYEKLKTDFYGLAATKLFDDVELVFDEMLVRPLVSDKEPRSARLSEQSDSPSYLLVSDFSLDPKQVGLKYAFMTASGRGSLPNAEVKLDRANLDKILDKFDPEND